MQIGQNDFTFLCTNINGSPVTSINISSGFTLFGDVSNYDISTYVSSIKEEQDGYYTLSLNLDKVGQGYFGVTPVTSGIYVTPDFFDVTLDTYDFDSLYSLFLTLSETGVTSTNTANFMEVTTLPFKASDDIKLDYLVATNITPTLTNWTNFKAELRNDSSLTSSSSASYLGLCDVTVIDALTNSVSVAISGSLTTGAIPEGSNTANVYVDLQAISPTSKKKTLISFTIPIVREITYN